MPHPAPQSCSVAVVWPVSHERILQVWCIRKQTAPTHTQLTVLQIRRLYRKEGKLSGALEVFSNIWQRFEWILLLLLLLLLLLGANTDRSPTSQLPVSQDFWSSFRCFDGNTILRFHNFSVYPRKTVLRAYFCSASAQCSKLHSGHIQ